MIQTIANLESPATWPSKVKTLIDYWNGETALSSFGDARTALNSIAGDLGLDMLSDGAGAGEQRARINAIIGSVNETLPADASLYLDFLNNRYFGGVPDFTRPTSATDDITGTLETYAPNVLRNPLGYGALLEREGVNIIARSHITGVEVSGPNGFAVNGDTGTRDGASAEPNTDTMTQDIHPLVFRTTGVGYAPFYSLGAPPGGKRVITMRVRALSGQLTGISSPASQFTVTSSKGFPVSEEDGWKTIEVAIASTSDPLFFVMAGTSSANWEYAYIQVENDVDVASSYIPTEGATASRAADLLSLTTIPGYNLQEGTFLIEAEVTPFEGQQRLFRSYTGSDAAYAFSIATNPGSSKNLSATLFGRPTLSIGSLAGLDKFKVAVSYDDAGLRASLNGGAIVDLADATPLTRVPTFTEIGARRSQADQFWGSRIAQIAYSPRAYTNNELQEWAA